RFAVVWCHVRLRCGPGGLHEGVIVCPGRQGDTGPLFHSSGFLSPRLRQFGCQRLGPVVLLLQRLPQFRRLTLGRLLALRRLVALLAPLRHLRLDFFPRLRQFGCQRLGPVVLLLQRLPQLRRLALGRLLELRRLVALLARQRHLRLDCFPRLCQFRCQRLGPVVLVLQRLPHLRRLALGRLLELRRLVALLARRRRRHLDGSQGLPRLGCQRRTSAASLFERVPPHAGRQLFFCSGGISREGGHLFALLAERLCGGRGLRFQLQIEPIDGAGGLGRLLRQNLL